MSIHHFSSKRLRPSTYTGKARVPLSKNDRVTLFPPLHPWRTACLEHACAEQRQCTGLAADVDA